MEQHGVRVKRAETRSRSARRVGECVGQRREDTVGGGRSISTWRSNLWTRRSLVDKGFPFTRRPSTLPEQVVLDRAAVRPPAVTLRFPRRLHPFRRQACEFTPDFTPSKSQPRARATC